MFQELDADDLYAELIMLRSNDARAFILVEGAADCAVLDRFVNAEAFITVPAHGKERALGAVEHAYQGDRLTALYAILDRDWTGFLVDGLEHHAVVYTDFYDLDACIFFAAGVYEALAASFCTDLSFRHGTPGCTHQDISAACVKLALPLGLLRYISHRDGLGLNLRDFPLSQVIKRPADGVDLVELLELACKRAKKDPAHYGGILPILQQELAEVAQGERYCSGHDLAKAFSLLARRQWASKTGHDGVERAARAAFGQHLFEQTGMFRESGRWSTSTETPVWKQTASRT
ncbi:hypothetical protein AB0E04_48515 [Streptomyces sp. NPDC048251]|uniref:hypothetical protein n=1 Tax=Streptomyces sp. NPDC048251 TaxID=3154501 RepID=UPI003437D63A